MYQQEMVMKEKMKREEFWETSEVEVEATLQMAILHLQMCYLS
jgi:hypothetical protein